MVWQTVCFCSRTWCKISIEDDCSGVMSNVDKVQRRKCDMIRGEVVRWKKPGGHFCSLMPDPLTTLCLD